MGIKNRKLIFAVIIALIFILGLSVFFYKNKSGRFQPSEISKELQLQNQISEIIETKNFERCDEVDDEMYKNVCVNNIVLNLALETLDISYCYKLDDQLMSVASCERELVMKKSLDKEDINVCDEATNEEPRKRCRDLFWFNLALKKNDIKICDNYQIGKDRNYCYDEYLFQKEFLGNTEKFNCDLFQGSQTRTDCGIFQANQNDLIGACRKMKSGLFINYCHF